MMLSPYYSIYTVCCSGAFPGSQAREQGARPPQPLGALIQGAGQWYQRNTIASASLHDPQPSTPSLTRAVPDGASEVSRSK